MPAIGQRPTPRKRNGHGDLLVLLRLRLPFPCEECKRCKGGKSKRHHDKHSLCIDRPTLSDGLVTVPEFPLPGVLLDSVTNSDRFGSGGSRMMGVVGCR